MQTTAKRLAAIADELSEQFLERTATVRALLVAMLAGQHAFLLGPPGTAKSQLARALTGRVDGAVFWETLLDRFSDPQHIFGPLDLAALKEGRYRHATAGHAAEAHIGFVDEIFKCLTGDTLVTMADGSRRRLDSFSTTDRPALLSVTDDGRLISQTAVQFVAKPSEPVWCLRLASGRQVRATGDHRFLTDRGWRPLRQLRAGDMVATPRILPLFGTRAMADHDVNLVALLLADGGCTTPQIRYTKSDPALIETARAAVAAAGDELVQVNPGVFRVRGPHQHVRGLVQRLGLATRSVSKTIPDAIFTLPRAQLARFIGVLWSGDGTIVGQEVAYASSSRPLLEGLQHLLLRFGVVATISDVTADPRFPAYRLRVRRFSAATFRAEFGAHVLGAKGARLAAAALTSRVSDRRSGVAGDVWFDRVATVTPAGEEPTYCFQMRGVPNFVAGDVVVHNCNSASLNAMLAWLNERVFHNGPEVMDCPLVFAVGASNELPSGEETAAIWDRLLVRLEVTYLQDPSNFAQLVRSAVVAVTAPTPTTVELADLIQAVNVDVPAMGVPDAMVDAVCQLRGELRSQELVVSDRRWRQCVRLLQASAYLAGRDAVAADDLAILATTLWDRPEHRAAVERQVLQLVNPNARQALELRDAVEEVNAELSRRLQEVQGQSADRHLAVVADWVIKEANQKLAKARNTLKALLEESKRAGRSTATIQEIHTRATAVYRRLLAEGLGQPESTIEIKD